MARRIWHSECEMMTLVVIETICELTAKVLDRAPLEALRRAPDERGIRDGDEA